MDLKQRAKQSYERGRWVDASLWVVPVLAWTYLCWHFGAVVWPAPVLAALVVGLRVVGLDWGRGVMVGLAAGVMTGLYPLLYACASSCSPWCALECSFFGGLAALVFYKQLPKKQAIAALLVCGCSASMGCLAMGTGGLWGAVAVVCLGGGFQVASGLRQRPA